MAWYAEYEPVRFECASALNKLTEAGARTERYSLSVNSVISSVIVCMYVSLMSWGPTEGQQTKFCLYSSSQNIAP